MKLVSVHEIKTVEASWKRLYTFYDIVCELSSSVLPSPHPSLRKPFFRGGSRRKECILFHYRRTGILSAKFSSAEQEQG